MDITIYVIIAAVSFIMGIAAEKEATKPNEED